MNKPKDKTGVPEKTAGSDKPSDEHGQLSLSWFIKSFPFAKLVAAAGALVAFGVLIGTILMTNQLTEKERELSKLDRKVEECQKVETFMSLSNEEKNRILSKTTPKEPPLVVTYQGKPIEDEVDVLADHLIAENKCVNLPVLIENMGPKGLRVTSAEVQTTPQYLNAGSEPVFDGSKVSYYRSQVLVFKTPAKVKLIDYPLIMSPSEHRSATINVCKGTWASGEPTRASKDDAILNMPFKSKETVPIKFVLFEEQSKPFVREVSLTVRNPSNANVWGDGLPSVR
jgi:hypothetical protein